MSDIKNIASFIDRYREFQSDKSDSLIDEFKTDFKRLVEGYKKANEEWQRERREYAVDFNLFYILRIGRHETKTHTPIIADLLNPEGRHCQGKLFLREFFSLMEKLYGEQGISLSFHEDIENYRWEVDTDYYIGGGYLDILIRCPRLRHIVVIENKVDSGEGPDQLSRYAEWMEKMKDRHPHQLMKDRHRHQLLIFLTPDGRESVTAGGYPYQRMSYIVDIVKMLKNSKAKIAAPRLRESLEQYLEIVSELAREVQDEQI